MKMNWLVAKTHWKTTRTAIAAMLCFTLATSASLPAQDRVALLIANSDYGEHQLPEAEANVEKLAKSLESAGFTVTVKENVEKDFRRDSSGSRITL